MKKKECYFLLASLLLVFLLTISCYTDYFVGTSTPSINQLSPLAGTNITKVESVFRRPLPVRVVQKPSNTLSINSPTSSTNGDFSNKQNESFVKKPTTIESWMKEMEDKYFEINERIRNVCEELQLYNPSDMKNRNPSELKSNVYKHMIVDMKHGLSYCRHGKVGTTTLLYHFSHLTNKIGSEIQSAIENQDQHSYQIMHTHVPSKFRLKDSGFKSTDDVLKASLNNNSFFQSYNDYLENNDILSFSFVRHPFERLVSAYEDKVLNNNSNDGQLKKFSNNFPAFVDYILKQYKRSSCYHKHNTPCGINVHWRPYNARCLYCDISYDVIGRMETFDEDFKYILARKNLTDLFNRSGTHIHKSQSDESKSRTFVNANKKSKDYKSEDNTLRSMRYFKELSKKQIQDLYKMYYFDFKLFDYDITRYFEIHKN